MHNQIDLLFAILNLKKKKLFLDNKVSEDIAQVYSEVKPCLQESSERTNPEYKAYNDDRFSHCEGSENGLENDLNDSLSNAQENLNSSDDREKKTTVLTHPSCSDLTKNSDSKEANKKVEKHFLFSQKSQDAENDVVKELKLISANSVRQKVEQLNKTFAENNRQEKSNLKASESWKCITCTYVNSRSRLTCFACNAKKLPLKPKPDEPGIQKEEPKKSLNKVSTYV